jgi:hypothetical protein
MSTHQAVPPLARGEGISWIVCALAWGTRAPIKANNTIARMDFIEILDAVNRMFVLMSC